MKTVAILANTVVPLPLIKDHPKTITYGTEERNFSDEYSRKTEYGTRAWKLAEYLSKHDCVEVTLYIPSIYYPQSVYVDTSSLKFNIVPYNIKPATWYWSEELDRRLKNYDFVVVQSNSGVGLQNCTVLPSSVNLIVDGFTPTFAETQCSLLTSPKVYRKVFWDRLHYQYVELLKRANCMLFASDRQYYNYEGQFFAIKKLDWKAFQFSPLLKIPYGIDKNQPITRSGSSKKLKLLWYGALQPWLEPEKLLNEIMQLSNVEIDFVGLQDTNNGKLYTTFYKKYFEDDSVSSLGIVHPENSIENISLSDYDAGIILARDWLEEKYAIRGTALELLSYGLPILLNKGNSLFHELGDLPDSVYPISYESIKENIEQYISIKDSLTVSKESFEYLQSKLSWDSVIAPLVEYIKRF